MHRKMQSIARGYLSAGLLCSLALLLASCVSPPMYTHTKDRIDNSRDNLDNIDQKAFKSAPTTVTKSGAYIDTNPISLDQPPAWLDQPITVHGTHLPFDFFVNRILSQTGAFVHYDSRISRDKKISMNYKGTIRGALEDLQVISDYAYDVHGNTVSWSALETKTFNIAFLPGKSSFEVGGDSSSASSSSGSGGSGTVQQTTAAGLDTGGQYSRLESDTDIWSDLEKSLNSLISADGKVMVSQATTTVTVQDHPENVNKIENFIEKLNRTLSQQVLLDVQVLDVTLNHGFSYGINWNLLGSQASLQGNTTPLNISGVGGSTGIILGFGKQVSDANGDSNTGSTTSVPEIAINALKQQGNISVLTQPRVVTLNNQVAAVNITAEQGYLASVSSFQGSLGNSTTSEVTPGQVVSGLVLYILPKIEGEEVYLQVSMTIAGVAQITNVSTIGQGSTSTDGFSQIQVPNQSFQSFNQRAKVPTGNTLVLSGFKRLDQEANKNSLFGVDPLGGKGAQTTNEELVVMITPTILGVTQ